MYHKILIIGEPGSGKTSSVRTLPVEETFMISVANKKMPLKHNGGYVVCDKENPHGNFFKGANSYEDIMKKIMYIESKRPEIKHIIIDDLQYLMCNEMFECAMEKGYDRFTLIAKNMMRFIEFCISRDKTNIIILTHSEISDSKTAWMKLVGKMTREKGDPEGKFEIVLHSVFLDDKYYFLTNREKDYLARSPMGMFEKKLIPNDLNAVLKAADDFLN